MLPNLYEGSNLFIAPQLALLGSPSTSLTPSPVRDRQHVSKRNSEGPPAFAPSGLLSRSASAKQTGSAPSWPSWAASLPKQHPHEAPQQTEQLACDPPPSAASNSLPAGSDKPGAFQITAAKPSLLAQIQAVSQQDARGASVRQPSHACTSVSSGDPKPESGWIQRMSHPSCLA